MHPDSIQRQRVRNPKHNFCPTGSEDNWCFYNRAVAKGLAPGSHNDNIHTPLQPDAAEAIKPIYDCLTGKALLEKCQRAMTQNANKSLHSVIWNKCPKNKFMSKERVKLGVSSAIATFNKGQRAIRKSLEAQGISPGQTFDKAAQKEDLRRIKRSQKQSDEKREERASSKIHCKSCSRSEAARAQKGVTYASGQLD